MVRIIASNCFSDARSNFFEGDECDGITFDNCNHFSHILEEVEFKKSQKLSKKTKSKKQVPFVFGKKIS